jgi:predicted dehydrogenase
MRLGVIGCGQIVEAGHAPALRAAREVEPVAVADVSERRGRIVAEALAGTAEPTVYRDYRRLLARDDLDAVLLATPPGLHREHAVAVAASGRHIVCEKPLATTLADADAILAACEASGARCQMVHNYASFEEHARAFELIAAGAIGRPHTAILQGLGSYPWDGVADFQPGWRYEPGLAGGGCLMDAGVHGIYLAELFFGGRPSGVSADLHFGPVAANGEVRCFARYRFADGLALLHVGEGHGGCAVEVIGEQGRIELAYRPGTRFFDTWPDELRLHRDGELVTAEAISPRHAHVTPAFYADLLERLSGPPRYEHSARHGRDLLATILATYLAAHRGREVDPGATVPVDLYENGASGLWT